MHRLQVEDAPCRQLSEVESQRSQVVYGTMGLWVPTEDHSAIIMTHNQIHLERLIQILPKGNGVPFLVSQVVQTVLIGLLLKREFGPWRGCSVELIEFLCSLVIRSF